MLYAIRARDKGEEVVRRQLFLPVPSIILAGSPPFSDHAAGPLRCGSWGRRRLEAMPWPNDPGE